MKPEDKKPRKRRSKKQPITIAMEIQPQAVELKDHLEEKIHKWEVLKGQWNEYYRKNRERIFM
jgi:hypothetical protein